MAHDFFHLGGGRAALRSLRARIQTPQLVEGMRFPF